jgi:hypothetical protein
MTPQDPPDEHDPTFDASAQGYWKSMEIGGFFLLVIIVVVLGLVGAGIYAIAARGRQKQLTTDADAPGAQDGRDGAPPEHVEVTSEQRAHFVDTP